MLIWPTFSTPWAADIMGAGTDIIKVRGVHPLCMAAPILSFRIRSRRAPIWPLWLPPAAVCCIKNVIPKHLDCITAKLLEMGVQIEERGDDLLVSRTGTMHHTNVKTMPYPGFPTDMQSQIAVCLCLAEGTSLVTEGIWENRYRYADELKRMGAQDPGGRQGGCDRRRPQTDRRSGSGL